MVRRTPLVLPAAQEGKNKENVKEGGSQLSVHFSSLSRQEDAEAAALADIGIDAEMEW